MNTSKKNDFIFHLYIYSLRSEKYSHSEWPADDIICFTEYCFIGFFVYRWKYLRIEFRIIAYVVVIHSGLLM